MLKEGVPELLSNCQGLKVMRNLVCSSEHRARSVTLNFASLEIQACELIQNWIALWKGTFIHQTLNMLIHSSETIAQENWFLGIVGVVKPLLTPCFSKIMFLFPRKCICIYSPLSSSLHSQHLKYFLRT